MNINLSYPNYNKSDEVYFGGRAECSRQSFSVLKSHNIKKAENLKVRKAENHYSKRTLEKQRKTVLSWDQIYFYKKWFTSEQRFKVNYSAIPNRIALSIQWRKYSCTGEKEDIVEKRNQTLIIQGQGKEKRTIKNLYIDST